MTRWIVDASVAAKWFFPEEHSRDAMRLISHRNELFAPDLLWAEFGNILWKRVCRREISADEAGRILHDFLGLPIQFIPSFGLLPAAMEIAVATKRTLYDCLYLASAVHRHCRLFSADDRFISALAEFPYAKHLLFIGDV
jgi:predicted nucleic acid-binding protein